MTNYKDIPILGWAGLTSLFIIAFHGLVDVVYYIERTLPIVGFIIGYAHFVNPTDKSKSKIITTPTFSFQKYLRPAFFLFSLTTLLILALFFNRQMLSIFFSNSGSIYQTNKELSIYDPSNFNELTMDQVRQSINLDKAIHNFRRALFYKPDNLTALQRLTEIELSRGNFDIAKSQVAIIKSYGFNDDVSRLLFGDVFITEYDATSAAKVVAGIPHAEERLLFQGYYRYYRNGDNERAKTAWEAVLLIDPNNKQAISNLTNLENNTIP